MNQIGIVLLAFCVVGAGYAKDQASQQDSQLNPRILNTIKTAVQPKDRKLMFPFFNPYMMHPYGAMMNPMTNPMMNPMMMYNPMYSMMGMMNPMFSMMGMMNMFNPVLYNGMGNWMQNNMNSNNNNNQQKTNRKLFADDISQLNLPGELPPMMQQELNHAEAKSQNDLNKQLAGLEGIDMKEHEGFSDYLGQVIASDPRL